MGDGPAPATLLHYRVVAKLGAGGMGEVWKAEDQRLRRPVAIKRLSGGEDQATRRRLLREARTASALSHPHIVTIFAIEEVDDQAFIATPMPGSPSRPARTSGRSSSSGAPPRCSSRTSSR
jgi:serine/threonine-protein kinase